MIDVVPRFDWRRWVPLTGEEPPPPVDDTLLVPEPSENIQVALGPSWTRRQVTSGDETWGPTGLEVDLVAGDYYFRPIPAGDVTIVALMERTTQAGSFIGPAVVDDVGTGIMSTFYHNPAGLITVLLATYTYAGSGNFNGPLAGSASMPAGAHAIRLRKQGTNYYSSYSTDYGATWSAEVTPWAGTSIVPTRMGFGCSLGAENNVQFLEFYPGDEEEEEPPPDPGETGWVVDDDLSTALRAFSVEAGRSSFTVNTEPVQASVVLGATRAGDPPEIGDRFRISLTDELATDLDLDADQAARFTGEVTDVLIEPERKLYTITAVGRLGRIRRRTVDGTRWPVEDDGARVERILQVAAPDAEISIGAGSVDLIVPPEPTPAGQLLDLVADSTLGQVVEQIDGLIRWDPKNARRGATPVLELSASQIDRAIRWEQRVGDVVNEVTVSYGVSNAIVQARDPYSIDRLEAYAVSVTTALTNKSDAQSLGSYLVGRRAEPIWQLPTLLVDLTTERVDDDLLADLLILQHGDLISLTGIPAGSPYPASTDVFVEGVVESAEYVGGGEYVWRRTFAVSDPRLSGVAIRWIDILPGDTWVEIDPTLSWLDLATVTDPADLVI